MDQYTQPQWSKSALLTIDVQEDFTRPGTPAYISGTETILPYLQKLLKHYRRINQPIYHIVRFYKPDGTNAEICRKKSVEEGQHIVSPGSEGAELAKELKPNNSLRLNASQLMKGEPQQIGNNEWALLKPRWGAFFQTKLEKLLFELKVSTLVVTSCNFPNCPRTSIYEASEHDFRIVLASDAVSGLYLRGKQELENIGVAILKTRQIINRSTAQQ